MSNLIDFIGGKSSKLFTENVINVLAGVDTTSFKLITSSETFVAPYDGEYFVILQGGGGSGGAASSGSSGTQANATGGASGDLKAISVTLSESENVVVTIGAGGAGVTPPSLGSYSDGNSGGQTSFGSYLSTTVVNNKGYGIYSNSYPSQSLEGFMLGGKGGAYGGEITDIFLAVSSTYSPINKLDTSSGIIGSYNSGSGGGNSLLCKGSDGSSLISEDARLGSGSGGSGRTNTGGSSGNGGDGFALIIYKGDWE